MTVHETNLPTSKPNVRPLRHRDVEATTQVSRVDPLGNDRAEDAIKVVSVRSLIRVALVASETTACFLREGRTEDPMAWMLAPRRLFRGASALEACLEREDFVKALILHGLGLGLDADPDKFPV